MPVRSGREGYSVRTPESRVRSSGWMAAPGAESPEICGSSRPELGGGPVVRSAPLPSARRTRTLGGVLRETRYAKSGEVHIAYQVVGDGPIDLVLIPGLFTHVEHQWEEPSFARFLERLASFSRQPLQEPREARFLPLMLHV